MAGLRHPPLMLPARLAIATKAIVQTPVEIPLQVVNFAFWSPKINFYLYLVQ